MNTLRQKKEPEEEALKPFQMWVYDTKSKFFLSECKREVEIINMHDDDTLEAFNQVMDINGWA